MSGGCYREVTAASHGLEMSQVGFTTRDGIVGMTISEVALGQNVGGEGWEEKDYSCLTKHT